MARKGKEGAETTHFGGTHFPEFNHVSSGKSTQLDFELALLAIPAKQAQIFRNVIGQKLAKAGFSSLG